MWFLQGRSGLPHCDPCLREYPAGSRFCVECGSPLLDARSPASPSSISSARFTGSRTGPIVAEEPEPYGLGSGRSIERRHLTVLFCDLVDSTRLSARVDPEDWHHAMGLFHYTARAAITRYAGYVAQFQGDGVIAYFGFPVAYEDGPSRAVRAGLAIVEGLKALRERTADLGVGPLAVRVGIHTGLAVVEKIEHELHRETTAIGTPANVAARIQAVAEPNGIVISETVRRLTAGEFVTADLGIFELRGVDRPPRVYSVTAASGVRSRLKAAETLTPFVGRDREVDLLREHWDRIEHGGGRAVLLVGEAGIGKSRLVLTFQQQLADQPHTWLECRALEYTKHAAFEPIMELIRQGLELSENDGHKEKQARIRRRAARDGMDADELYAIVAPLIGLASETATGNVDPEARARTIQTFVNWTLTLARTQPVVLLVEDLHWCDPSTIEFLQRLLEQDLESRILVLMTARPDFESPWSPESGVALMTLERLPKDTSRELVRLAHQDALTSEATEAIIERADGIPLYVEELAKMVVETVQQEGDGSVGAASGDAEVIRRAPVIPETLQDLLMARLDLLGVAKKTAQLAAVIGREIPLPLLERVSLMSQPALQASIERLIRAGILFTHDLPSQRILIFKHALIQDAAYQSLLRAERRLYHDKIARELVRNFPEVASTRPEIIARHCTEARRPIEAADYWTKAGKRALESSATVEAIAYAEAGLAIVGTIAQEPARLSAELNLQLVLGPALMASRGYADPSMERAYGRARELCRQLGDPPALFPVMFGLWTIHCVRARHDDAAAIARDMTALAERDRNDSLLLEADVTAGITHFYVGELDLSRRRLERALALYDPERDAEHCLIFGQDPRAAALAHLMLARWTLGDVDGAKSAAVDAVALAREMTHPFSIGYTLSFAAWLHRLRGDADRCLALARDGIEVSGKRTLAVFLAISEILEGSATVSLGNHSGGRERLEAGFERFTATTSTLIMPFWYCLRAQACADAGRIEEGLVEIAQAISLIANTGERQCEAEAFRIRALLRKAAGAGSEEIEADLRHAIAVAGSQGALSWQLRAAVDLAGELAETARREDALSLLLEIRAGFAGESDESDIRACDALIAELRTVRQFSRTRSRPFLAKTPGPALLAKPRPSI